ncbi:Crp/Fnr family transcriptional regulator [Piscinibacter sakaiensis]|nr:Crp/Fnr family transcriptional regulator [Piscinibacter sakaiensis]
MTRAIPEAAGPAARARGLVLRSRWARALTPAQRERVLAEVEEREVPAGACALHAGEVVAHWAGVAEGFAKMSVTSPEGRVSTLTGVCAGVWFGEGSLMKHEARRYDVCALRPLRLALLPKAVFDWLRQTSIPFNHHLQDLMNARLSLFIGMLSDDRLLDTDARVAHALASLFDDDLYPDASRQVSLSQVEVGLLANVSRQRANVALRRLHAQSLLRIGRAGLTVIDIEGLRRVASGRPAGLP